VAHDVAAAAPGSRFHGDEGRPAFDPAQLADAAREELVREDAGNGEAVIRPDRRSLGGKGRSNKEQQQSWAGDGDAHAAAFARGDWCGRLRE
jgi:hypothetical protein